MFTPLANDIVTGTSIMAAAIYTNTVQEKKNNVASACDSEHCVHVICNNAAECPRMNT